MRRKRLLSLIMTAALLFAAVPAFAEEDDPSPPPVAEPSPSPLPTPSPSPSPPPPVFPEWFYETADIPAWIFMTDSFPPWFSELPAEPVWFRAIDRFPDWFFTLTEIPGWFFPEEPEEPAIPEGCPFCWEYPCVCEEEPEVCEDCLEEPCVCEEVPIPCFTCWEYPCVCNDFPPNGDGYPWPETADLPFAVQTVVGELRSGVPNGMISGGEVRLNLPAGLFVTRNEFEVFWTDGEPFRDNGRYEVFAIDHPDRPVFTFTIAIGPVNFLDTYTAPNGFYIAEASCNGELLEINNRASLTLEADGAYFIILRPDRVPEFGETQENLFVVLEIDRTPPVLFFEGVDEDGAAAGEVTITAEEPLHIRILRNNRPYTENISVLTEPGHYIIIATDRAGNESVYHLRIGYRMNASGIWVIALFAALIAALTVYLIRNRKKVRIR